MRSIRKQLADILDGAPPAPVVGLSDPVSLAVERMRDPPCTAVLVEDNGGVVGIFTERDLLNRVIAPGRRIDVPVGEVMTPSPMQLPAVACVTYAIHRMGIERVSNLPILDAEGRAIAMLGVKDVVRHLDYVLAELDDSDDLDDPDSPWLDIGGGG